MKLIGLFGELSSGKDTAAEVLISDLDYVKIGLADPMKRACRDFFGWSDEQLFGPSDLRNIVDHRYGFSPREALQKLGTEYGRALHVDMWVDRLLRQVAEWQWNGTVVPDLRFQNEIDRIREFGGSIVKIVRPGRKKTVYAEHSSEAGQSTIPDAAFDSVIVNDGTLEELRWEILAFEKTVKPVEEIR